ncbi:MAG: carbamoylphosphate synthase large subunit, partial [Bacilli bacterium]|nr:carbamoylphosphate synthase large subunit [Bacilli bacterium]
MNFVFVSPNFPVRYFKWVESLSRRGITVLGIGDTPFFDTEPRLRNALREYYYLRDLSSFEEMKKAIAYFESKYGHIDYIESNNEWWLENDARLREEFSVSTGFHPAEMRKIKSKSEMKKCFSAAGIKTMRYVLANGPKDLSKVKRFAAKVGYPLFVKPDVGVGASNSYKLDDEAALCSFLKEELPETYIIEEYVSGTIVSYDGICDGESNVVFDTTDHFPIPPSEIVDGSKDDYYYVNPFFLPMNDLDAKSFRAMGRSAVKSFGIKKRFFHIEFFVLGVDKEGFASRGEIVALECNMRPPGGYTPDLINFGESLSCYEIYADVIAYNENRQDLNKRKYYAITAARRDNLSY